MDMTQYAGSESKYLKSADLHGKKIKVFIENVGIVEFENDDGKETKPCLKLKGHEKQVVCNATSVTSLGDAYGYDSDAWIGKEIGLSTKHYPTLGKDGLVITPLDVPVEQFEDIIPF